MCMGKASRSHFYEDFSLHAFFSHDDFWKFLRNIPSKLYVKIIPIGCDAKDLVTMITLEASFNIPLKSHALRAL